jgi:hypothetical protein
MAGWKQFILSGSSAEVTSVSLGSFNSDGTNGNISASGKVFALASDPQSGEETGGLATTDVLIRLSTGEFAVTSSTTFTTLYSNALSAGSGLTGTGAYDGNIARRFTFDSASLAGNGLGASGTSFAVGAGNNIDVSSTALSVNSESLTRDGDNRSKGLTADPLLTTAGSGSVIAVNLDLASLVFEGEGAIIKRAPGVGSGATALGNLTDGAGIEDFTFNYEDNVTMNLDSASLAGTMVTAKGVGGNAKKLMLANTTSSLFLDAQPVRYIQKAKVSANDSGAEAVIFEGSKLIFENTTGTQLSLSGSTPTATDHNGTNVFGNFQVVGSSSFAHSSDFNVSEKFILVNSGSSPAATDDFGYTGQISATKAIFWAYTGSAAGGAFRFASGSANGGQLSDSNIFGKMRLHLGNTSGNPNSNAYSTFHKQSGNTIVDSGGTAVDSFYMYVE